MIAKQTVFLTGDRSKAVPEGHADAKFLLVREGSEIADKEAEKYNAVALIDTPAKKAPVEPQQTPPPNLKEQPASTTPAAVPRVFEQIGKTPKATPAKSAAPADGKSSKKKSGRPTKKK